MDLWQRIFTSWMSECDLLTTATHFSHISDCTCARWANYHNIVTNACARSSGGENHVIESLTDTDRHTEWWVPEPWFKAGTCWGGGGGLTTDHWPLNTDHAVPAIKRIVKPITHRISRKIWSKSWPLDPPHWSSHHRTSWSPSHNHNPPPPVANNELSLCLSAFLIRTPSRRLCCFHAFIHFATFPSNFG